ncbi:protein lifeguard 1-like isoform X2 [Myotis myotis]|uniref:protein lifeguard 1-like isoform X2 n=1 Tax=Myotis myotis TaxID=51298 RepID=UPI00174E14B3|nr:protein lifeguard 1-like isoform X2 [Myotis myotis]
MDLEVSEPVDFSTGDHQHLVRKAGDNSTQPESKETKATPPSPELKQTHGKPKPKTNQRADFYVVEISDETTPEESNAEASPFSEASIRRGFIVKVFLLLSAQLVITGAIISVFIFWLGLKNWVHKNPWFTYAIFPAFFAVLIVLACCENLRRQVPANYLLLGLFLDFTLLNEVLFVLLVVLLIYGILLIFIRSYWLHLLYAALGTVLFSFYLVMDVQLLMGGSHHVQLDPEEYVFAALNIYLDIINLFIFILQLIGR